MDENRKLEVWSCPSFEERDMNDDTELSLAGNDDGGLYS